MGDSTQQLWEIYPPEDKNSFFHAYVAYVYAKYILKLLTSFQTYQKGNHWT